MINSIQKTYLAKVMAITVCVWPYPDLLGEIHRLLHLSDARGQLLLRVDESHHDLSMYVHGDDHPAMRVMLGRPAHLQRAK